MILVYLGLGLIVAAWLIQMAAALKTKKEIQKGFLLIYALGALVLAYDGYSQGGDMLPSALNIATTLLAGIVFLKTR